MREVMPIVPDLDPSLRDSDFRPVVSKEDEELRQALIALLTFVLEPDQPTDDDIKKCWWEK